MNKIVSKEQYSDKVFKIVVEAPLIAQSRKAGNFVIIRIGEKGERIPLTIAEADTKQGTITLVVQKVGLSSTKLCKSVTCESTASARAMNRAFSREVPGKSAR